MSTKTIKLTDEQGNLILPESGERGVGYTKFADGTLLYAGSVNVSPERMTAKSDVVTGLHRFVSSGLVTFPVQFVATPEISAMVRQNTSAVFLISQAIPSATGVDIELWTNLTTWSSFTMSFLAFGRWK